MKNKRNWSNSEMRSLTRGEAMHHFSKGEHYYVDKDWYIWFLVTLLGMLFFILSCGNTETEKWLAIRI